MHLLNEAEESVKECRKVTHKKKKITEISRECNQQVKVIITLTLFWQKAGTVSISLNVRSARKTCVQNLESYGIQDPLKIQNIWNKYS